MNYSRISKTTGIALIVAATLVDLAQFFATFLALIPFIGFVIVFAANTLISVCALIFFGICFSHVGVSLLDSRRALGTLGTILGEAVPFINSMLWWTCLVSYIVITEWRKPEGAVE